MKGRNGKRHAHTHTRLTALFPGLPRSADNRKVKSIGILVKQETVSGSGISWAIYKSAPHSRQITTPAPQHSTGKRNKIKFEARKEQRKRREEKGREREGMAGRKMGNQREKREENRQSEEGHCIGKGKMKLKKHL